VLLSVGDEETGTPLALRRVLLKTKPKQTVELSLKARGEAPERSAATLTRHPLEIIRPEEGYRKPSLIMDPGEDRRPRSASRGTPRFRGPSLERRRWELVSPKPGEQAGGKPVTEVVFKTTLPQGLEIYKRFFLTPIQPLAPAGDAAKADGREG